MALELLLGAQLKTKIRCFLAAALAMLAWTIFTFVNRAFRPAPDIFAQAAINLVFGAKTLCHF